jgi:hypothetical protein
MNKRIFVAVISIIGLAIVFFAVVAKKNAAEPITITVNASSRELTIDDKINEAQIIVIGELRTTLPSKWKLHNEKDTKNATPQEIFDARGLFTDFLLSISQTLKGNIDDPIIRVRSFFGETKQVRWEDSSQVSYEKGRLYLLFLRSGTGPTANVDPGYYSSVNASAAVYEIVNGKAISADDEWVLEELIAYIQKSLTDEASSPKLIPTSTELLIETLTSLPAPTETPSTTLTSTPAELLSETFTPSPEPVDLPTQTEFPTETINPTP